MQATAFNCRVCIIRIGLVLGAEGGALARCYLRIGVVWAAIGFWPEQMVSWIAAQI